jgi:hypothetical protein
VQRSIVVALRGGLGNQLFQYASGLGIATRLGADLRLTSSEVDQREHWLPQILGPHHREASRLELLRVGVADRGPRTIDKLVRESVRISVGAARRLRGRTPVERGQDGPDIGCYDPSLFTVDLPVFLRGWYQTERYFEAIAEDLHARLRLPAVDFPAGLEARRPLVAVSFRRGDYVRYGWQLPLSYYERALTRMVDAVPDAHFLVFGDDAEFVHLVTDRVARHGPATDAYDVHDGVLEHLALAAACDHAVLANSSFAWWGAWLAERRPGRRPGLVLAPTAYPERFGAGVVPDRWELVPTC